MFRIVIIGIYIIIAVIHPIWAIDEEGVIFPGEYG